MAKNRLALICRKIGLPVFILLMIAIPLTAFGATWTVCTGGGCNYLTISAAYASGAVANGDTLELHSNITDNVTFNSSTKNVNITSQA